MVSTSRSLTLADVVLPRTGTLPTALLVIGASALTALAAQVAIPVPWSPVPLTGQTFAVLLSGALLGARRAALAQVLYLLEGALGLPVFAGGASVAALAGPSAGYLFAFPVAAAVTGALAERGWDRHFAGTLAAMLLGSLVILGAGVAVLALFVPRAQLLAAGLLPFLPGDIVKAALAAFVFPRAWRAIGHEGTAR